MVHCGLLKDTLPLLFAHSNALKRIASTSGVVIVGPLPLLP
jgi:hypothetical protein